MTVLRYFAAAKAAAGVAEESFDGATLAAVLSSAGEAHGPRMVAVLSCCSFVVDGQPVGTRPHEDVVLPASAVVDCLPPFAGG